MRAQIRIARIVEHTGRLVMPYGAQGRARPAREIAVVDKQCCAGRASKPLTESRGQRRRGRADLDDRAARRGAQEGRDQQGQRPAFRSLGKSEATVGVERDEPLGPFRVSAHQLPDRQRVEELIGDHQQRPRRQRLDAVDKLRLGRGEPPLLLGAQHRACFDEIETQRAAERRHAGGGAQQIGHQRAMPRTQLGQNDRIGPADTLPQIGAPQPDQLAEDLADLGRGDEIAGAPERIVAGVVAGLRVVQCDRDEGGDGNRPMPADVPGNAGP